MPHICSATQPVSECKIPQATQIQIGRPDMTTFERVGFIGLGGMGRGLVKNLVAKGVAVTAYDLNPAAVAVAQSFGATAAGGIQEIRDDCRIVMICVNEAEDVEALMVARDGLLARPQ